MLTGSKIQKTVYNPLSPSYPQIDFNQAVSVILDVFLSFTRRGSSRSPGVAVFLTLLASLKDVGRLAIVDSGRALASDG